MLASGYCGQREALVECCSGNCTVQGGSRTQETHRRADVLVCARRLVQGQLHAGAGEGDSATQILGAKASTVWAASSINVLMCRFGSRAGIAGCWISALCEGGALGEVWDGTLTELRFNSACLSNDLWRMWCAGCGVHNPRHHQQGGVLVHDRVGTRFPGLHELSACAEPRVRVNSRGTLAS